jgi:hypothetical protein
LGSDISGQVTGQGSKDDRSQHIAHSQAFYRVALGEKFHEVEFIINKE